MDYPNFVGMEKIDSPIKRDHNEVLAKLQELAAENDLILGIVRNAQDFPDNMLHSLANNPEMADFVSGYNKLDRTSPEGLTESEKNKEFPLFLQWDPRWGYEHYGDNSYVGLAGCGPVCLSMVIYYLTRNHKATPNIIAAYSMENGHYLPGIGTKWTLMNDIPPLYGINVSEPKISEKTMKDELDLGNVIICSMKQGDFTIAGHFIVIYGYDDLGFKVNDPNCVARSRQRWSYGNIGSQIKNIWCFSKMENTKLNSNT